MSHLTLENLRQKFMKDFFAPNDFKKIQIRTPTLIGSEKYEDILFSKTFLSTLWLA